MGEVEDHDGRPLYNAEIRKWWWKKRVIIYGNTVTKYKTMDDFRMHNPIQKPETQEKEVSKGIFVEGTLGDIEPEALEKEFSKGLSAERILENIEPEAQEKHRSLEEMIEKEKGS